MYKRFGQPPAAKPTRLKYRRNIVTIYAGIAGFTFEEGIEGQELGGLNLTSYMQTQNSCTGLFLVFVWVRLRLYGYVDIRNITCTRNSWRLVLRHLDRGFFVMKNG